jgi:hypothetical protein
MSGDIQYGGYWPFSWLDLLNSAIVPFDGDASVLISKVRSLSHTTEEPHLNYAS